MESITIFGLGYKAFHAIRSIEVDDLKYIQNIVIGQDEDIQEDYSSVIISFCENNNIPYIVKNKNYLSVSNYLIAIGWRWIIKKNEKQKLIVFHDSILPRLRGFNPLVTALINGDTEIGVTALFGEDEYDKGAIISIEKTKIEYPIKIADAITIISDCYARILKNVIADLKTGEIKSIPQDETNATYSLWRDFNDYYIDWNWSALKIKRFIDAVGFPYLGARVKTEEMEYIVHEATPLSDIKIENRTAGKLIFKDDSRPVIVCGTGLLRLDTVGKVEDDQIDTLSKFRIRFI